jgi:hypothetical protein
MLIQESLEVNEWYGRGAGYRGISVGITVRPLLR